MSLLGRCYFCSSGAHGEYERGVDGALMCADKRRQILNPQITCKFRHCNFNMEHMTAACVQMQSRCNVCGCMGHTSCSGMCWNMPPMYFETMRTYYEEVADLGFFTGCRRVDRSRGFYPYNPRVRLSVRYDDLGTIPVQDAIRLSDPHARILKTWASARQA